MNRVVFDFTTNHPVKTFYSGQNCLSETIADVHPERFPADEPPLCSDPAADAQEGAAPEGAGPQN